MDANVFIAPGAVELYLDYWPCNKIQYNSKQYNTIDFRLRREPPFRAPKDDILVSIQIVELTDYSRNRFQKNNTAQFNTMQYKLIQCNYSRLLAAQYNTIQYNCWPKPTPPLPLGSETNAQRRSLRMSALLAGIHHPRY